MLSGYLVSLLLNTLPVLMHLLLLWFPVIYCGVSQYVPGFQCIYSSLSFPQ